MAYAYTRNKLSENLAGGRIACCSHCLYCLSPLKIHPQQSRFPKSERQWLKAHPVITLAPDPDFKPIEYFDKNGTYQGAAADIIRILEKKLGITITIARAKKLGRSNGQVQKP